MRTWLAASMLLAVAQNAIADPAARERAAVIAVDLGPTIPAYLGARATGQIEAGLAAAGFDVVPAGQDASSIGALASCRDSACMRQVGDALAVQAIVHATIAAEADNTIVTLRLFDAGTGQQDAEVREVCELCGEAELSERLSVAASALRARAVEARERRVQVKPIAPPPGGTPRPTPLAPSRSIVPGIALGASGVVALAGGIYLIAIDGNGTCKSGDQPVFPDPDAVIRYSDPSNPDVFVCRRVYKTMLPGIASAGLGAAAIAIGAVLVVRARDRRALEVVPAPGGATVKVTVPW